ncbi:MAG: molybdopterin molybdotransferase MoeA [Alphaproteobacteria bacterium]|nr:molybdopterin molybdotransferase MoeA [Alphaproteobacteria bacterium]MDE2630679.1 molybdopterin molybdotransferase MoeA [Alphaproteobacteria bacterium]
MISVAEAEKRIAAAFSPIDTEIMDVAHLAGRVLVEDAVARTDQPPAPVSAMDGFAVRLADGGAPRRLIGSAPAGHPFARTVGAGEAVRIFTGGVVPQGADAIVIQEDAASDGVMVSFDAAACAPQHIRAPGLDFKKGEVLAAKGRRLTARDCALLAAGDIAQVKVRRRPCVAIISIGDELSRPGEKRMAGGIVASSGYGLYAMIQAWGGAPCDFGILLDNEAEIATVADADADLIITLGGVSVGDHDLVRKVLGTKDFALEFWKVAMRPGKPLIFGKLGRTPLLGLPGNPISTLVCAILFVKPAIAAMLGTPFEQEILAAKLVRALPANGARQDYMRAKLTRRDGEYWAEAFAVQDSSMLTVMAQADALIVRAPGAPAAAAGDRADVILLDDH